jgi:hypothetical protein
MNALDLLAEARIQEAIAAGLLNEHPYKGRPLPRDNAAMVPEEVRGAYRILKNAGLIPEELELRKEIVRLRDLLLVVEDEADFRSMRRRLNEKILRYEMLMERRGRPWAAGAYQARIIRRFGD